MGNGETKKPASGGRMLAGCSNCKQNQDRNDSSSQKWQAMSLLKVKPHKSSSFFLHKLTFFLVELT